MSSLVPVVGILFAAAITPGPNNMIVMAAGARAGMLAALVATAGVVAGSLLLLVLVAIGVGTAMQTWPQLQTALGISGGAYLAWLGILLMTRRTADDPDAPGPALPATTLRIAVFQLLNPKAWILVTTAAAAMPRRGSFATLAILIALITSICLVLWGATGAFSSRLLAQPIARRWFDRVMGALMTVFAMNIVLDALAQGSER